MLSTGLRRFLIFLLFTGLILVLSFAIYSRYQTIASTPKNSFVLTTKVQPPYLESEEVVVVKSEEDPTIEIPLPVEKTLFEYVEVVDSCGPHYDGDCLVVRNGPGTDFPVVTSLRNGQVLKINGMVEREDYNWYKVVFDEYLRYPDRLAKNWYVASDFVEILYDEGDKNTWEHTYSTTSKKVIVVDRSEQSLTAKDGEKVFMTTKISTGLELTPTPRGTFTVFKKTPSRYMQGPLPYLVDQQVYDLPGVPWNLYFTQEGAVIHGAYWHNSFGRPYSHGCVNMKPEEARALYTWADLGTKVIVQD
jgi:hypothetical protein